MVGKQSAHGKIQNLGGWQRWRQGRRRQNAHPHLFCDVCRGPLPRPDRRGAPPLAWSESGLRRWSHRSRDDSRQQSGSQPVHALHRQRHAGAGPAHSGNPRGRSHAGLARPSLSGDRRSAARQIQQQLARRSGQGRGGDRRHSDRLRGDCANRADGAGRPDRLAPRPLHRVRVRRQNLDFADRRDRHLDPALRRRGIRRIPAGYKRRNLRADSIREPVCAHLLRWRHMGTARRPRRVRRQPASRRGGWRTRLSGQRGLYRQRAVVRAVTRRHRLVSTGRAGLRLLVHPALERLRLCGAQWRRRQRNLDLAERPRGHVDAHLHQRDAVLPCHRAGWALHSGWQRLQHPDI